MPAKIKLEIEGTAWEIMEAFNAFVAPGKTIQIVAEPGHDVTPEEWAGPEVIVDAELLDKMEAETKVLRKRKGAAAYCSFCGKVLTVKQIDRGSKYCSPRCGALDNNEKRKATRKANALKKKVEVLTGRTCMECGKELIKQQKKFCSRACSNRFHNKKRNGVTVTKWKPSISVVAGQGVRKGSALTA